MRTALGLLARLFSFLSTPSHTRTRTRSHAARRAPPPAFADGWGHLGAVGESFYQPVLQRVARSGRVCWATLVPEPDNPFDGNSVVVQIQGETVGHLTRSDARRYQRRLLTLTTPMQVPAKLIGGERDKPNFGVLLDCRAVEQLPKPKPLRKKKVTVDPTDQPF